MSDSIEILGDIVSPIVSRGADRVAKTARQPARTTAGRRTQLERCCGGPRLGGPRTRKFVTYETVVDAGAVLRADDFE
jgi:hypothetical protein